KFFLFAATTEMGDLNPYEEARQKRIQENQKKIEALGISNMANSLAQGKKSK
ncbi:hypothetical protein CCACVL1_07412, partial [Corchorus capsularis]